MDERGNLDNLRDIIAPGPPPLWPPTPELWVLLSTLVFLAGIAYYHWRRQRRANAHRRAGVSLLQEATTLHDVSVILKRVALVSFPREQVASLYGEQWSAFLSRTCRRQDFTPLAQSATDIVADRKTRRLAAQWIRHHQSPLQAGLD